jgi:hypothetical protein
MLEVPNQKMDFYGLMKGELLVIVDLFTREAILLWLPSRKQEKVAHTILRRGVPLCIRSESVPELMKEVVRRICITSISICYEHHLIPPPCVRPLKTVMASPLNQSRTGHGARDMDLDADDFLEDVDKYFDSNELTSVSMSEIVRSTSEWHRRMSSKKLSQNGKSINHEALVLGAVAYFYKPPSAQEVEKRVHKATHLDHYMGPATILRSVGTRSFIIQYTNEKGVTRTYQRDAAYDIIDTRQEN